MAEGEGASAALRWGRRKKQRRRRANAPTDSAHPSDVFENSGSGSGFAMGKGEEVKENEGEAARISEGPIWGFFKNLTSIVQISPPISG